MKNHEQIIQEQVDWIASGKIGCVFASALVRKAHKIGWHFSVAPDDLVFTEDTYIASFIFPDKNILEVKDWALKHSLYIENTSDLYQGLRIKIDDNVSWVQYFGPDSHVKTRQAPYPMLSFTARLPKKYYWRVGFEGILHLAHASVEFLHPDKANTLWDRSIIKTKKELGHSLGIAEAAKTTFQKNGKMKNVTSDTENC